MFNAMPCAPNGINYFAPSLIILPQSDVGPRLPGTLNCLISTNQSVFMCGRTRRPTRAHVRGNE